MSVGLLNVHIEQLLVEHYRAFTTGRTLQGLHKVKLAGSLPLVPRLGLHLGPLAWHLYYIPKVNAQQHSY